MLKITMDIMNKISFYKVFNRVVELVKNEHGYYSFGKEKDKFGNEKLRVDTSTVNILIICIALLFFTIMLLAYKAQLFSLAIVFSLVISFLIYIAYIFRTASSESKNDHINKILFVLLILCLVILGFNISDIINLSKFFITR